MEDIISLINMDNYKKLLASYHRRYGPDCWALIYQADVRARREHLERLRRIAADHHSRGIIQGTTHPYDPNRPWDYVWKMLLNDAAFWRKEVEDLSMLILNKVTNASSHVTGESPISLTPGGLAVPTPPPPQRSSKGGGTVSNRDRPAPKTRKHNLKADGNYATNRSGVPLCVGWQDGTCTESAPGTHICLRDRRSVHQCSKCLDGNHGAKDCRSDSARIPNFVTTS